MNRTKYLVRKTLACLAVASVLLSVTACGEPESDEVMADTQEVVVGMPVKTQNPQSGDLTQATSYMGTVEPDRLVQVKSKMGGTVQTINVKVGDQVKKGDLLMTFDTVDIAVNLAAQEAQIEVARAAVMTSQAQVDQALGSTFDLNVANLESGIQQAKNSYASARQGLRDYTDSNSTPSDQIAAQRDKARENVTILETQLNAATLNYNDIYNIHGSSTAAADKLLVANAKSNMDSAKSSLRQAEDQLSLLNSNYNDDDKDTQLRGLRTGVRNAQLAYDSANTIYELTKNDVRNDSLKVSNASLGQAAASFDAAVKGYEAQAHQLSFAQIISPIDGIVEACDVTESATANAGDTLFTISNKSKLVVTFYVSETSALQLTLGDKIKIESGSNFYDGTLTEIGIKVDDTGLFKVKASIDNGDLMSGVTVKVTADTGKASGLMIPQSAIFYENGVGYVYVEENGKAIRKDITIGLSNNDIAEVKSGIDIKSNLIVTWNPNLREGADVSVTTGEESPLDANATPEPTDEVSPEGAAK